MSQQPYIPNDFGLFASPPVHLMRHLPPIRLSRQHSVITTRLVILKINLPVRHVKARESISVYSLASTRSLQQQQKQQQYQQNHHSSPSVNNFMSSSYPLTMYPTPESNVFNLQTQSRAMNLFPPLRRKTKCIKSSKVRSNLHRRPGR